MAAPPGTAPRAQRLEFDSLHAKQQRQRAGQRHCALRRQLVQRKRHVATRAVTLRNSTISHSGEYGIQFENTLPASLTNLRFENNGAVRPMPTWKTTPIRLCCRGTAAWATSTTACKWTARSRERSHGTGTTPSPSSSTVT
ncbi:MAG: hypothetical protein R2873_18750 [Caldilineaceae bacterium]